MKNKKYQEWLAHTLEDPDLTAELQAVKDDPELAKKSATLLYDQALLIAGLPMEDPSAYTDLVCELLTK